MAGFVSTAKCAGTCPGDETSHAFTYDAVNQKLYAICRVCGANHVETRKNLIEYAKSGREPDKGRLNILR